jgi:hypothetical protein
VPAKLYIVIVFNTIKLLERDNVFLFARKKTGLRATPVAVATKTVVSKRFIRRTYQRQSTSVGGTQVGSCNLLDVNLPDGKASHLKVALLFHAPSLPPRRLCCRGSLAGSSTREALPTSCRLSKLCSASLLSSEVSDANAKQLVRMALVQAE